MVEKSWYSRIYFRLLVVSLFLVVALQPALAATAINGSGGQKRNSEMRLRVLIDASKDGGLWWFAPRPSQFNPQPAYQGKAIADAMRKRGWELVELPRGSLITPDLLKDFDVVIRPSASFPYSEAEAIAYRGSVASGLRLLLASSTDHSRDKVEEMFGLRFEQNAQMASVQKWIPHPLTAHIEEGNLPWRAITEKPNDAVTLAWLDREEPTSRSVLGGYAYGQGLVMFVGLSLVSLPSSSPLLNNILNYFSDSSPEGNLEVLTSPPVYAQEIAGLPAPQLISPVEGATLQQPGNGEMRFQWEEVPGAQQYQITVLGPRASFPILNAKIHVPEAIIPKKKGAYVVAHNLEGWTWRVRAQDQQGKWGAWSETRRFNIAPVETR